MNEPSPTASIAAHKKAAFKRAMYGPGLGAAYVQNIRLGWMNIAAWLSLTLATVWLCWQPSLLTLLVTLLIFIVASCISMAELYSIWTTTSAAPGNSILVRYYLPVAFGMGVVAVFMIGMLIMSFGFVVMRGKGMAPTLHDREPLIYHKLSDGTQLGPGDVCVYRNASDSGWGTPGALMVSRLLAEAGDTISIRDGVYVINEVDGPTVADTTNATSVLVIPTYPDSVTVPPHRFFVAQDSPHGGYDSQVLSWVRTDV